LGQAGTNLKAVLGFGMGKSLGIGVRNKELHALQARGHHVVDGIATGTTDAEHEDPWAQFSEVR
jgi:hypothetical protein